MLLAVAVLIFDGDTQVEAADVYAVTENNGGKITDYYVVTETIQSKGPTFGLAVHAVGKNWKHNEYSNFFYAYQNGAWYFVPGGNLAVAMQISKIQDDMFRSVVYGIFKTARQYM